LVLGKCRQNTYEYGNGIAEQEGYLNINSKVSDYIGTGWTLTLAKLITNSHLLTMTSGIEDIANGDDVTQQVYNIKQMQEHVGHIIMYIKLQDVVAKATKQTDNYFNTR
jgi:CubicO group peptidase (beta-lactamase class C family)